MEKIYMENNQMENNQNNQKNSNKNFWFSKSMLGSLVLAAIVVVAVVIVGLNQTSYAIPDVDNAFAEKFTTADPGDPIISNTGFSVLPYTTTDGLVVYCMEHGVDFKSGIEFSKGDEIQDYGLLYLMANIYPHVKFKNSEGVELPKDVQVWISQVAIWLYLAEEYPDNPNYTLAVGETMTAEAALNNIKTAQSLMINNSPLSYTTEGKQVADVSSTDKTFYEVFLQPLVNKAKANKTVPNKDLGIVMNTDVVDKTSDGEYYQSSKIRVEGAPSDNFLGYAVELVNAPEGTIIVDVNGNKISDLSGFTPTSEFYIRVPVKKVTEENKVVSFKVTGNFKVYSGYYYVADGAQKISSVDTVNVKVQKGKEFTLDYSPEVPDTGVTAAQTIYFIGLIILLSGVGIIYANVKPAENK